MTTQSPSTLGCLIAYSVALIGIAVVLSWALAAYGEAVIAYLMGGQE